VLKSKDRCSIFIAVDSLGVDLNDNEEEQH
jgi:hypothetical protein